MQTTPNAPRRRLRPAAWLGALAASLLLHVLASTPLLALALACTVGHQPWMHAMYPPLSALGAAGALASVAGGLVSLQGRRQRPALKQAAAMP